GRQSVTVNKNLPPAGASFTWSAWIRPASSAPNQVLAAKADSTSQGPGHKGFFLFYDGAAHNLKLFQYGSGDLFRVATPPGAIPLNVWTHVAITRMADGTGASWAIYINGAGAEKLHVPALADAPVQDLTFASLSYSPALFYTGLLDEIHLYDRALSRTE